MDDAELLIHLEEQDRERARSSFLAFYMRMTGFLPPRHVRVLCRLLQSMEEDKVDRAMVFMPPRHAKTTLCSHLFPAWIMGRQPRSKVMVISHTADYAMQIGAQIRSKVWAPEWPFDGVRLSGDTAAKDRWRTTHGGEVNTFGAMAGNQHGRPAEWLIMDDMIGGREVALSPGQSAKVWLNYLADMRTRLQRRRKQMMVFTRWHLNDPAGRILPENYDGRTGWYADRNTGEKWFVLSMPAVAEHDNDPCGRQIGEWLWPEEYGERQLGHERMRGGWMWASVYQQRPSPEEGLMFGPQHLEARYDPLAVDTTQMRIYLTSDYATKAEAGGTDPDYTVHLVWGVDPDWNIYLLDGWRGRTESNIWVAEWIRLAKKWKPLLAGEEQGQIIRSIGPFLTRIMDQERVYVQRVQIVSDTSKEQRAQALLGMAAMGKMFLPDRAKCPPELLPLIEAFESELLQFPGGKHDDTVDAASLFARLLDRIVAGQRGPRARSPHGDTLNDLWSRAAEEARRRERE